MYQPEPQSITFSTLIHEIDKGIIKIPQFQRDFVWSIDQSAKLIDSIIKGYPIGTFILWESQEKLRSVRNIGGANLPDTPTGSMVQYVLDGQQRMTSLYASLKGLKVKRDKGLDDFSAIYVDLVANEDDPIIITSIEERDPSEVISLRNLLNGGISVLAAYPATMYQKLEDYKNRLYTYRFSTILLRGASIDVATEVFTRLNVGGKSLTVFEIMVAKTYDAELEFDLAEKFEGLIETLEQVGYETISDSTVLQTISILLVGECARKNILKLDKQALISIWDEAVDAIEKAVEYFRNYYRIPVSKILPYNALIVPFSYFFYHHPVKPVNEMRKHLDDFFWRVSLSERYSSGVETKLAQDIKRVDQILKGRLPNYDFQPDTSKENIINNGGFSANRSFIKAILCLMAYQEPKSFNDNSIVRINNDWLKQANSRNYHHFFPRAYLKNRGENEFYINHIVNITIVDDFLNKNRIRAQAPSKYMKTFEKENKELDKVMKTHLIDDLDAFGIWKDDYDVFFDQRAEKISQELTKRIIPQKVGIQKP
ncbi:GmrSD restriction endonuclease domain-containing protein [Neobacillus vireti]|uniref:GmrSD restriction endonuclease domain-containing protein n=1 Tax=Neobacillus vireti TaxID=220686 RepID=UPI003000F27F